MIMTQSMYTKLWLENLKKPLGGHRLRWENNIKTGLREIGSEHVNWIELPHDMVQWCGLQ
jgi:hypothetical protein